MGKMVLSIVEMGEYLGIGRSLAYSLAHEDGFPCFRVGKRILIPVKELDSWLCQKASTFDRKAS